MRVMSILSMCALFLLLTGCSDALSDIKEAASGIHSAADQAASAISQDAHTVRAIELSYEGVTFTMNDLFKSVLRDVQWHFDEQLNNLTVTGTWQPSLFSQYGLTAAKYDKLAVFGEVKVQLTIENDTLVQEETMVSVSYKEHLILEKQGIDVLHSLFEEYITN